MTKLGEEREHNLSELNQKRVQHVTTLQQMGKHNLICSCSNETIMKKWYPDKNEIRRNIAFV